MIPWSQIINNLRFLHDVPESPISDPTTKTGVNVKKSLSHFLRDETGATAVEYVILVGAIAGVVIAGAAYLTTEMSTKFSDMFDSGPAITGN